MRTGLLISFFLFLLISHGWSQLHLKDIVIADDSTRTAISGAHIFVRNSTIGAYSGDAGHFDLEIPEAVSNDLVISHIGYETKLVSPWAFHGLDFRDTIFLKVKEIKLDEIVIESSRDRKWKRRLRKFEEAFLGTGRAASYCTIENPEILMFSEEDDKLYAYAQEQLMITNKYLGYYIQFELVDFILDKNGFLKYSGNASFSSFDPEQLNDSHLDNRERAYRNSLNHFLISLIKNDLDDQYQVRNTTYDEGIFSQVQLPDRSELIRFDSTLGLFQLRFPYFLEVSHLNQKRLKRSSLGGFTSQQGSPGYNTNQSLEASSHEYEVSMLYKVSSSLWIDRTGQIVNKDDFREYGFWARQRMALQLPLDYKLVDLSPETVIDPNGNFDLTSYELVRKLITSPPHMINDILSRVNVRWKDSYLPALLELVRMGSEPELTAGILQMLQNKYGQKNMSGYFEGLQWLWDQPPLYDSTFAEVKAEIYRYVDPSFKDYFSGHQKQANIRLDEIIWGGVRQNGIPPLHLPSLVPGKEAKYLKEDDMIFGVVINGQPRAYPQRILGWHELALDTLGGREIAVVYCTLCGTVIPYDLQYGDKIYRLGTSGFLYRSNKLMFDHSTQSLWSTMTGQPVLGPLTRKDVSLDVYGVETTTWKDWQSSYPESTVLDIHTGFERDYSEGAAYREYFATDRLMFPVNQRNEVLPNKQQVLIVRVPNWQSDPTAIDLDHLKRKTKLDLEIAGQEVRIRYSEKEGIEVYSGSVKKGTRKHIPAHHTFWFAWYAQFPDTRLITD